MPNVKIDPASMAAFRKAVARAEKETRRSTLDAVQWAAVHFAMSARARSKPPPGKRTQVARGQKHHKVEANPDFDKAVGARTGKNIRRYRIVKLRQGNKPPAYVYTDDQKDKRRKIARAGLAWASWGMLLPKLDSRKKGRAAKGIATRARRATKVSKSSASISPSITVRNSLQYISTDSPHLVSAALQASANKVNKLLDDRAKRLAKRF